MAWTSRNVGAEFKAKVVLDMISGSKSAHSFPRRPNLMEFLVVQRPDQVW